MFDLIERHADKLRFIMGGILIIASLFLLSVLLSSTVKAQDRSASAEPVAATVHDGPNAVANGLGTVGDDLGRAADGMARTAGLAGQKTHHGFLSIGSAGLQGAHFIGSSVHSGLSLAAKGAGNGFRFMAHVGSGGIGLIARASGNIMGFATNNPVVNAAVKPETESPAAVIDPVSASLLATHAAMPAMQAVSQTTPEAVTTVLPQSPETAWPMRGQITTQFGVPHWPYQPWHTGLDISDGQPSGVTAVKPFKPGVVVSTVFSGSGLGNHVVVDHGGGLTSLYGHLYSISVGVGQVVDMNTKLGSQGSTGASTGTHLHLEISLNGQVADPRHYITGQP